MKSSNVRAIVFVASLCVALLVGATACSSTSSASSAAASESAAASSASPEAEGSASAEASASDAPASSEAPEASAQAESAEAQVSVSGAAVDADSQVFEGTVRVVSPEELIALQDIDIDPEMASHGGTYAVLVFDQPTAVTGMGADGSGARTEDATMLGLAEHTDYESFIVEYGDLETWGPLDGQQVTVSAKAEDITFPSDVRLPIGEPAANAVEIVSEG